MIYVLMPGLVFVLILPVWGSAVIFVGQILIRAQMAIGCTGFGIALFPFVPARTAFLQRTALVRVDVVFAVRMVTREIATVSSCRLLVFHGLKF